MGTIAGNPLTVSTTTQLMVPADTMRCYTLVNDGLYTVYGLGNPRAIPSMTTKTAAELLAISPAPFALNAGEAIELEHLSALYVAVASDGGGTSVVRLMPGRMSGAINATVNGGNVGLLNADETEVNPATEDTLQVIAGSNITAGAINSVTVGATTTVVLAAGATRERVILSNLGTERIDVAVGTAAIAGKGIGIPVAGTVVLTPSGGCKLAINAICASGGMALAYQTLATA